MKGGAFLNWNEDIIVGLSAADSNQKTAYLLRIEQTVYDQLNNMFMCKVKLQ